jgi:outer membrane protein assembly factor BamE
MMRAYYDASSSPIEYVMSRIILIALIFSAFAVTNGCVYRSSISQGNLIEQEDLDQLEVGMTRNQVRFLLGTPMVDDPFHASRWDYVYFLKVGRKDATFKRWVSVVFDGNTVSEIRKDQELDPEL